MSVDRQEIEEFIEQSERPTVAKILGHFMLDPSEHHGRIERILSETTGSAVSADSTEQVKITDGGVVYNSCASVLSLVYGSSLTPMRGGRDPTPPQGGSGLTRTTSEAVEGSQ